MQRLSCPCVYHADTWHNTVTAPLSLNLSTKWRFTSGFTPQPSCPGEKGSLLPNEWVGELQKKPGSTGEEEKELSIVWPPVLSLHLPCYFRLTGSQLTHNPKTWESNVAFVPEYHVRHEYKQLGSNSAWRWVATYQHRCLQSDRHNTSCSQQRRGEAVLGVILYKVAGRKIQLHTFTVCVCVQPMSISL